MKLTNARADGSFEGKRTFNWTALECKNFYQRTAPHKCLTKKTLLSKKWRENLILCCMSEITDQNKGTGKRLSISSEGLIEIYGRCVIRTVYNGENVSGTGSHERLIDIPGVGALSPRVVLFFVNFVHLGARPPPCLFLFFDSSCKRIKMISHLIKNTNAILI